MTIKILNATKNDKVLVFLTSWSPVILIQIYSHILTVYHQTEETLSYDTNCYTEIQFNSDANHLELEQA